MSTSQLSLVLYRPHPLISQSASSETTGNSSLGHFRRQPPTGRTSQCSLGRRADAGGHVAPQHRSPSRCVRLTRARLALEPAAPRPGTASRSAGQRAAETDSRARASVRSGCPRGLPNSAAAPVTWCSLLARDAFDTVIRPLRPALSRAGEYSGERWVLGAGRVERWCLSWYVAKKCTYSHAATFPPFRQGNFRVKDQFLRCNHRKKTAKKT